VNLYFKYFFIVLINISNVLQSIDPTITNNQKTTALTNSLCIEFKSSTGRKKLKSSLMKFIRSAKESLKIAIYTLNDKNIADEIIKAQKRIAKKFPNGVNNVEIVIDGKNSLNKNENFITEAGCIANISDSLRSYGVTVHEFPYGNGHMHSKYVIVDDKKLWQGSLNFTDDGINHSKDSIIIINNKKNVDDALNNFKTLKIKKCFSKKNRGQQVIPSEAIHDKCFEEDSFDNLIKTNESEAKLLFSMPKSLKNHSNWIPDHDLENRIVKLINSAEESLFIAINHINSSKIIEAINKKSKELNNNVYIIADIRNFNLANVKTKLRLTAIKELKEDSYKETSEYKEKILEGNKLVRDGEKLKLTGTNLQSKKEFLNAGKQLLSYGYSLVSLGEKLKSQGEEAQSKCKEILSLALHNNVRFIFARRNSEKNPKTMHNKYIIVDEKVVAIGSFNFTEKANNENHESIEFINNSEFAREVLKDFKKLYNKCDLTLENLDLRRSDSSSDLDAS